ncbi:DUF4828 domain-containing protein [Paucilactobacillus wasatchensis]|uniref:DUF4828 domain-containing protein n=1 Tax=Paucilactobacillus wasatchensis TaxID=1335616 RepID=A0A0D1AA13_9LACO|nr:DUF4828 domain-containing protein [Paucilactobacillus wasatchensis]KIS03561.1 hypothetical protein WDC_0863 [Paucilactobacillus wasatchensis]
MKRHNILLFGAGLVAGLTSTLGFGRTKHVHTVSLPIFYAGSWNYYDPERNRNHHLEITPELKLSIDNHTIPTTVELIDEQQLIYIDKFGYHITIQANEQRPVKLIDDADDQTYTLTVPENKI